MLDFTQISENEWLAKPPRTRTCYKIRLDEIAGNYSVYRIHGDGTEMPLASSIRDSVDDLRYAMARADADAAFERAFTYRGK